MTMRLSAMSLAGTARTLVAVGTVSEASMLRAIAAAAPRSGLRSGSLVDFGGAVLAAAADEACFGSCLGAGFGAAGALDVGAFGAWAGSGAGFGAAFGSVFGADCVD